MLFNTKAAGAQGRAGRTIQATAVVVALVNVLAISPANAEPAVEKPWYTIEQRLQQYGPSARNRMRTHFERAAVSYPPGAVVLVALKEERRVELYAGDTPETLAHIRNYAVYGASGGAGPKLLSGDRQVPEGLYAIAGLNPNSLFHLSLRVSYPNAFDRSMAARDGRTNLGGDIYIHGGMESAGCLAVGDRNSEELFVLAADTGEKNVRVVLSPLDFRTSTTMPAGKAVPRWSVRLYDQIWQALDALPRPGAAPDSKVLRFFPDTNVRIALGFERDQEPATASAQPRATETMFSPQ